MEEKENNTEDYYKSLQSVRKKQKTKCDPSRHQETTLTVIAIFYKRHLK